MKKDQILTDAVHAVLSYSADTKAPVAQIICRKEQDEASHIYFLFPDIQAYAAMEQESLKDSLIGTFIRYLTSHDYPFEEQVRLKFHFSIQD